MVELPDPFRSWFARQGWELHAHQRALLARARAPALLLVAPTGGGKTLAGFLPSLVELAQDGHRGLHTLYVSPLKALAADIRRNLARPVSEMGLAVRVEDRTGDTGSAARRRQRADPPHILLTTPESLALLLSYQDAPRIFAGLNRVILDEVHALAESKRGDQLMLSIARLQGLVPGLRRVGLSATVEDRAALAGFMAAAPGRAEVIEAAPGPAPEIAMLETATPPPWSGGGGHHAVAEVMALIRAHRTTLVFHNTRAQAELFFRELWQINEEALPIGIHHGSLARAARERVEAAMAEGRLRAVVCTGSLDLGIDWGDVDLVVQIGAPKTVKRLVQRIGRANHRYDAPSRAVLVPANRFEVLECQAALEAVHARDLDGKARGPGGLDVLCQHILLTACAGPFDADALYAETCGAGPYAGLARADFDACLEFCATGGYALRAYDRWRRLMQGADGRWRLRDPRAAARLRMNIGTIVDTETLAVRLRGRRGGAALGEVEESFAASLAPGETFLIGGQVVRYEGLRDMVVEVSPSAARRPRVPVFSGTKFSTTTQLADRVARLIGGRDWSALPRDTRGWLALQAEVSALPRPGRLLVERFTHGGLAHGCFWGFAGRNAQQTLGLLLTRRMEEAGLGPLGFVASDYATLVWGLEHAADPAALLAPDGLRAALEDWLAENAVMKRTFRGVGIVAGLIERNLPGRRKTGRQATFSSDILYDTLRRHDPGHLMLRITRDEAMRGLVDFGRIEMMLARAEGRIDTVDTPHVTPFSAPLLLEVGRVPIRGDGAARLAEAAAADLLAAAGLAPCAPAPAALSLPR